MPCVREDTPADYVIHTDSDNGNKKASFALNALANVGMFLAHHKVSSNDSIPMHARL